MSDEYELDRFERAQLEARQGEKWARDRAAAIPMWVADMDFPIAPPVRRVLEETISTGDLGYPVASLEPSLASAFAAWERSRHGLDFDPVSVVVTTDVVQAIYFAIDALSDPGDGILTLTPAYPPYFGALDEKSRRLVAHDLAVIDGAYGFDVDALRALVATERPRLMLLCNPHNPTGRVFSRGELLELATIAIEADLVVISDEIHCDLVYPGSSHIPIASLGDEIAERTITLSSASKAFNLAGLRCAVAACGTAGLAARLRATPKRQRGRANNLGILAAITAWQEGTPWLEAVVAHLAANRDKVTGVLAGLDGVSCIPPEATYLAWLDLRGAGLGDDPAREIAASARVTLMSGTDFGAAGRGHARLNFATTTVVLDEALERLAAFLATR
ncbi:MAG: PatB family C-S lyase [Acidimicrobiales bacterium]|jgi:cystathionine beta-lyase